MTADNVRKQLIRAAMDATGRSFAEISRLANDLDRVLCDQPSLSTFGMGLSRTLGVTVAEQQVQFNRYRTELRDALPSVACVYYWLKTDIGMIRTPSWGSYGLKHVAENAIGQYVTNGELIAAALIAGYPMRAQRGPNPLFGVRKRDVDRAIAAIEQTTGSSV
jgi:hypothetical protein